MQFFRFRRLAALAIVFSCLAFLVSCGEPAFRDRLDQASMDRILSVYTTPEDYGIYLLGAKVGWMEMDVRTTGDEVGIHATMHLEMHSMGQTTLMDMEDARTFRARYPWGLVACSYSTRQDGQTVTGHLEPRDGSWVRIQEGSPDKVMDLARYSLADELSGDLLCLGTPRQGDTLASLSLSPSEGTVSPSRTTFLRRETEIVEGIPVELQVLRQEASGITLEVLVDDRGHIVRGHVGGVLELRREDAATARNLDDPRDLFSATSLAQDKPLGPGKVPRHLELAIPVDPSRLMDLPGQSVRPRGDGSLLVLDNPRPARPGTGPEELRKAREPTERFPSDMTEIRGMARSVAEGSPSDQGKVAALLHFTSLYIDDALIPDSLSMADLLSRRRGDCSEHSRFFVTLVRAAGIPAREVTGFYYMGDTLKAWGAHAWAEVWYGNEWHMVDPVLDQLDPDIFHIATRVDDGGIDALDGLGVFGGLTARLVLAE